MKEERNPEMGPLTLETLDDDGVKNLCVAMVKYAAQDYMAYYKYIKKHPKRVQAYKRLLEMDAKNNARLDDMWTNPQHMPIYRERLKRYGKWLTKFNRLTHKTRRKDDARDFFNSEMFGLFSEIEPKSLMKKLREKAYAEG